MSSELKLFDPSEYWDAAIAASKGLKRPGNINIGWSIIPYLEKIDSIRERVKEEGLTTGTPILDRLIASGQVLAPERLKELEAIEAMIKPGEPVMLQDHWNWRIGIAAEKRIDFTHIDRSMNPREWEYRGRQSIPAQGYLHLTFNPFMYFRAPRRDIDINSHMPSDDTSGSMDMYFDEPYSGFEGLESMPEGIFNAYWVHRDRNQTWAEKGAPAPESGTTHYDWENTGLAIHIGLENIETNLGVELTELLTLVDNEALHQYIQDKARAS